MTLKIAICDDEPKDIERIHAYLQNFEMQYDIDCEASEFHSAEGLLSQYHTADSFHVVFLDVEMPNMNGIELAKQIRQHKNKQVKIVFISNYPRYMQDSFEVHPFHYLTKPLQENEFQKLMEELIQDYEDSRIFKLVIQEEGKEELVNINDILYIEAVKGKKGYLSFVLPDRTIQGRGNLKDWEQELSSRHFLLSHRSILVNLNHIHFFKKDAITLTNGTILPLSRRKEKEIKTLFSRHILALRKE